MKKLLFTFFFFVNAFYASAQFIATMEVSEPIEGLCNYEEVYALFPMFGGQKEAVCPISKQELLERLNEEVSYLKENPKFKGKGLINVILNCDGEIVQCEMDGNSKTNSEVFDQQVLDVFLSLGVWKPGRLSSKKVDSIMLYSFKVKKGVIYWS